MNVGEKGKGDNEEGEELVQYIIIQEEVCLSPILLQKEESQNDGDDCHHGLDHRGN